MTTTDRAPAVARDTAGAHQTPAGEQQGKPLPAGGPALTLGSLCTGYGGLDMAMDAVLPVRLAWVADPDPGAAALLAHHHPGVPNLGDITAVDFTAVPPVDVLAAGFPCQDISYAGRGAGIKEGTRSGLWHTIADALAVLRPGLVVLENVRAIVARRPGLDVVLADLARLGLDAEWACVRASDVGAPHRRERWFLAAWPADADGPRLEGAGVRGAVAERREPAPDPQGDGRHERRTGSAREQGRPDVALGGRATADADRAELPRERPEQPWGTAAARSGGTAADPHGDPVRQQPVTEHRRDGAPVAGLPSAWGPYAPAIARWEHLTGRSAPDPTEPTPRGGRRLNPRFVEWLMGLDPGHVTAVPGLTRNQQLKLLGNGVVPVQAAAALAELLDRVEVR
jgi:DNA (cytosine-5)-methyltransferase 1